MATVSVYEKLMKYITRDYIEYINCLHSNKSSGGDCPATHQRYRAVTVAIIDLLMFDVFSVVIVAYVLVPPAARSFWARVLSRIFAALSKCMCQSCRKRKYMKLEDLEQQTSSEENEEERGSMNYLRFED